jgi:hypothetical protein
MSEANSFTFGNVDDWHTDRELVEHGAPFNAGKGRTITVRRAGGSNRRLISALATVSPDDTAAFHAAYARLVVSGWSGFTDREGKDIPYSTEACIALFDFCPELFFDLLLFSNNRANYRAKELAEDQDAVKKQSGGNEARAPISGN